MSRNEPLVLRVGREELVVRQRYEVVSIVNDLCSALMFVVGSVLFFREATVTFGTWLFLVGSVLLLFRPAIRLARRVHLTRLRGPGETSSPMDY